jgi:competence protein ComEC
MAIGFNEKKISSNLINFNISAIETARTKILDFHLNDCIIICIDASAKKTLY